MARRNNGEDIQAAGADATEWRSIIDGRNLIPSNPFEGDNPTASDKDIFHAFNILANKFYTPVTNRTLAWNALFFAIVFIGTYTGAEYAENFTETFAEEVIDINPSVGLDIGSSFAPLAYMVANTSIGELSLIQTLADIQKFVSGNPLYKEWVKNWQYTAFLGVDKALTLASLIFAGLASFALIAQNKDPDTTSSLPAHIWALITQYTAVGLNTTFFAWACSTLFKYSPDTIAALTGTTDDRENTYTAKVHIIEKLKYLPAKKLHVSTTTIAQGFNNKITPVFDVAALAGATALLYPYIMINYGDAADQQLDENTAFDHVARRLAPIATYAALGLCSKATAGLACAVVDKVHSLVTGTPTVHHASESSLMGLLVKTVLIGPLSVTRAAGLVLEFANPTTTTAPLPIGALIANTTTTTATTYTTTTPYTKEQVVDALLTAVRAMGINIGSFDRVSSIIYRKSAQFAPACAQNWANKTKFGANFEEFVCYVMKEVSSDASIRKLFTPALNNGEGQPLLSDTDDNDRNPIIGIQKQGYPDAALAGKFIATIKQRFFTAGESYQNFTIRDLQMYNAIVLLEYAKEAGYPLDNIYKADWLKKPLADPSSVVFTYLDTSLQHTMSP